MQLDLSPEWYARAMIEDDPTLSCTAGSPTRLQLLSELDDVYRFCAGLLDNESDVEEGLHELLLDLTIHGRPRAEWELSIADAFNQRDHAPLVKAAQPQNIGRTTPPKPGYQLRPPGGLTQPTQGQPVGQFKPPGRPQQPPQIRAPFQLSPTYAIGLALTNRRELVFEYTNVYTSATNIRRVKPLRTFVAKSTGNFILLTWDLVRVNWRCFIVSRMRKVQMGQKFVVDRNKLRDEIKLHFLRKEIR